MKVLICGAGRVTVHLLKRLGENWQVTVVDKSEERLSSLLPASQTVQKVFAGDASSPVVLDDAGVGEVDYVLALTDDDRVNLAICKYAEERGVKNTLSLVSDQENQPKFDELNVRAVKINSLLASDIYHYLQDPRINVLPLSLGKGEVMEVDVSHHLRMVGRRVSSLSDPEWKLVALFRNEGLVFPDVDTVVEPGDRLVILGKPDIYQPVCTFLECGRPPFPLAYGRGLLLGLLPDREPEGIISESVHLAQNTKVRNITVLSSETKETVSERLSAWSQTLDIHIEAVEGELPERIQEMAGRESYGLVVVDPFEASFLKTLAKPTLIALAHVLPCPLLIARHTHPYQRLLVPFNASPKAELGLEVAVDLARQLRAEVALAVVEEPEFIRGQEGKDWVQSVIQRSREIAHIHKMQFEELIRRGNPVRELVDIAKDFNLMVVGSATKEKGLFSPHVGELLAQGAPCSVLIVTN